MLRCVGNACGICFFIQTCGKYSHAEGTLALASWPLQHKNAVLPLSRWSAGTPTAFWQSSLMWDTPHPRPGGGGGPSRPWRGAPARALRKDNLRALWHQRCKNDSFNVFMRISGSWSESKRLIILPRFRVENHDFSTRFLHLESQPVLLSDPPFQDGDPFIIWGGCGWWGSRVHRNAHTGNILRIVILLPDCFDSILFSSKHATTFISRTLLNCIYRRREYFLKESIHEGWSRCSGPSSPSSVPSRPLSPGLPAIAIFVVTCRLIPGWSLAKPTWVGDHFVSIRDFRKFETTVTVKIQEINIFVGFRLCGFSLLRFWKSLLAFRRSRSS